MALDRKPAVYHVLSSPSSSKTTTMCTTYHQHQYPVDSSRSSYSIYNERALATRRRYFTSKAAGGPVPAATNILTLPDEILFNIFDILVKVSDLDILRPSVTDIPFFPLRSVCQAWRCLCSHTSSFWAHSHLELSFPSRENLESMSSSAVTSNERKALRLIRLFLEKQVGVRPFSITLNYPDSVRRRKLRTEEQDVLRAIYNRPHLITSITINAALVPDSIPYFNTRSFPIFHTLKVILTLGDNELSPIYNVDLDAPMLDRRTIQQVAQNGENISATHWCENHHIVQDKPCVGDVHLLCPTCQILTWRIYDPSEHYVPPSSKVHRTLPAVREFRIEGYSSKGLRSLLPVVTLPLLQSLTLQIFCKISTRSVVGLLMRSGCQVREFNLEKHSSLTEPQLLELLRSMPALQKFVLRQTGKTRFLIGYHFLSELLVHTQNNNRNSSSGGSDGLNAQQIVAPRLQHLELHGLVQYPPLLLDVITSRSINPFTSPLTSVSVKDWIMDDEHGSGGRFDQVLQERIDHIRRAGTRLVLPSNM